MKARVFYGFQIGLLTVLGLLLNMAWCHFVGEETFLPAEYLPYAFFAGFLTGFVLTYIKEYVGGLGR